MRATAPNGCRPGCRRFGRAAMLGEGATRRWRNDGRAVNVGRERMGKRLLRWCSRVRKRMSALDWMAFFFLVVFLLLLAWVAFCSKDCCSGDWICRLLGVTEKTEAINKLGLAVAGAVAFWGVVAANRRADAIEAGNRQRAFKDGVEHLGNSEASVRQGGAHALFHLALEDDGLRASIAGVLCAHIQETTGDKAYQEKNKDKPSTEMQSLMRLLFTTETADERRLEKFWQGITPDLDGGYFLGVKLESARFRGGKLNSAQFQGASLDKAQFQKASLEEAQFQGAQLREAQFQKASLEEAQFQGAQLREAQFQKASLEEAQFQGAQLREAQFQKASLGRAQFQRAFLGRAQFQRAFLGRAQFQRALLWGAQFQRASLVRPQFQRARLRESQFQGAWLKEAQFQGASLEKAQFQGASLEGPRFQGAWLRDARFQGAWLREARFQGASLEGAQFQGASLYMAGFQQAKFGQGPEHEDIPDQGRTVAKPDELAEQLKASAFHGVSSGSLDIRARESFEKRIINRTGKESDFPGVIFAGGVTPELLAEVKEALEGVPWLFDDPDFKEKLVQRLESEIGQPESHTKPKEVIAGSYGKEDAERWIKEFREAMATVPEANQAEQRRPASP